MLQLHLPPILCDNSLLYHSSALIFDFLMSHLLYNYYSIVNVCSKVSSYFSLPSIFCIAFHLSEFSVVLFRIIHLSEVPTVKVLSAKFCHIQALLLILPNSHLDLLSVPISLFISLRTIDLVLILLHLIC